MLITVLGIVLIGLGVLDHVRGNDLSLNRSGLKIFSALRENIITIGLILVLGGVSSMLGALVTAQQ